MEGCRSKYSDYLLVKLPKGVFVINRLGIIETEATTSPARNPINPWILISNKMSVFFVIAYKSK